MKQLKIGLFVVAAIGMADCCSAELKLKVLKFLHRNSNGEAAPEVYRKRESKGERDERQRLIKEEKLSPKKQKYQQIPDEAV